MRDAVVRHLADAARQQARRDGLIGTLGKFDPKTETVSCYEERLLLLYLAANNIADDNAVRRKAIFLSEMGRDIYQVLSVLCSPDKAASKMLDQLLKKLKDHFEPVPNEMAESFKCCTRVRKDNESITTTVWQLRN